MDYRLCVGVKVLITKSEIFFFFFFFDKKIYRYQKGNTLVHRE